MKIIKLKDVSKHICRNCAYRIEGNCKVNEPFPIIVKRNWKHKCLSKILNRYNFAMPSEVK